jgi:hypothetical protein
MRVARRHREVRALLHRHAARGGALRGDVANGLFFRGREALPFGTAIRSVRDLLELC